MLKSFEAVYDHGHLHWLTDSPNVNARMRVIVTVVQEIPDSPILENTPPPELVGKMRILCDDKILMEPVVPDEAWDALQ